MLDYWVPFVYCYSDSVIGFLLISAILFFYKKIWWIISGIAWKSGDLYLTFLLIFGFNAEFFLHYTFRQLLPQSRPLCTFTVELMGEREKAMPSFEAQLTFSIASFLTLHMGLMQRLTKMRAMLVIITFPIFTVFSLYVTRNNTFAQLVAGAIFGTINASLRILIYHFYIKRPLSMLSHYKPFNMIVPTTPITLTKYEDANDQTARMLDGVVEFEEIVPVEHEPVGETLLQEFSDALVGTRKRLSLPSVIDA